MASDVTRDDTSFLHFHRPMMATGVGAGQAVAQDKMTIDPTRLATLLESLSEIPVRVATMEHALAEAATKVEALRAASPPLLVPVTAAATIFKVSVPTMRRWVKRGQVPVVKVANTVRVDLSRVRGVDAEDIARMAREARVLR